MTPIIFKFMAKFQTLLLADIRRLPGYRNFNFHSQSLHTPASYIFALTRASMNDWWCQTNDFWRQLWILMATRSVLIYLIILYRVHSKMELTKFLIYYRICLKLSHFMVSLIPKKTTFNVWTMLANKTWQNSSWWRMSKVQVVFCGLPSSSTHPWENKNEMEWQNNLNFFRWTASKRFHVFHKKNFTQLLSVCGFTNDKGKKKNIESSSSWLTLIEQWQSSKLKIKIISRNLHITCFMVSLSKKKRTRRKLFPNFNPFFMRVFLSCLLSCWS